MYGNGQNLGYQEITLSATAASGLTIPGNPPYANAVLLRVQNGDIRYRLSGTAPTTGSTGGFPMLSNELPIWLEGIGLLQNFQAIGITGAPQLHVLYFGTMK